MKENQTEPTEINVALKDFLTRRLIGGSHGQFFKTIEEDLGVKISFKSVRGPAINISGAEENVKTAEVLLLQLDQKAGVYADEKGRKRSRQIKQKDWDHISVELAELLKEAKRVVVAEPAQEQRAVASPAPVAAPMMAEAPDPRSFFEDGAGQAFDEAARGGKGGKHRKKEKNKIILRDGFYPRNPSQAIGYIALNDPDIHVVMLAGDLGGGKTHLAVKYALEQIDKEILLFSPRTVAGQGDIGAMPGGPEEKMDFYTGNFADKVKEITNRSVNEFKHIKRLTPDGERGRNHHNTIMVVDEAQNLTIAEAKLLLTRMGQGSKCIIMGDISSNQNDIGAKMPGLAYLIATLGDKFNNGDKPLQNGMAFIRFTEKDSEARHPMMPSIIGAFNRPSEEYGKLMDTVTSYRKDGGLIQAIEKATEYARGVLETAAKRTFERYENVAKGAYPAVFGLKVKDNVVSIQAAAGAGSRSWTP